MTTRIPAEIAKDLRAHCESLRRKPTPLADLIPILQEAADAMDSGPKVQRKPVAMVVIRKDAPADFFIASEAPELSPGEYDLYLG
jgi:hypothetical protein